MTFKCKTIQLHGIDRSCEVVDDNRLKVCVMDLTAHGWEVRVQPWYRTSIELREIAKILDELNDTTNQR